MASTGYPHQKIHYVKGKVEQTLPRDAPPSPIALLRLDTDWYSSTKHELENLFPLLIAGGVLIIPRKEISSLAETGDDDAGLLGHLLNTVRKVAAQLGLSGGYRVVINCGPDGGQSVDHLHLHLLGGRQLTWPPG